MRFSERRRVLVRGGWGIALLAASASLPACAAQSSAPEMHVRRDPSCGCCQAWTEQMARSGQFRTTMTEQSDMNCVKRELGVPDDLVSCHTATVEGFVIEGHVPAADIMRLLAERPAGVRGLAVPGMPAGSPGMEMPDGRRDGFAVIAFRDSGTRHVFAQYAATG